MGAGAPSRRALTARLGTAAGLGLLLVLLVLPGGDSLVTIEERGRATALGSPTWVPFSATSTSAGPGPCTARSTAVVPTGPAPSRASVYLNETPTCRSLRAFTLLPSARFIDGLGVPAGHVLQASLTITALSGATTMVRTLRLFLQQVGGGNPRLSTTDATIRRGAIMIASTSTNPLAAAGTYGMGCQMTLVRPPTVSSARIALVFTFTQDDGGVVRAVLEESVALAITY